MLESISSGVGGGEGAEPYAGLQNELVLAWRKQFKTRNGNEIYTFD